MYCPPLCIQRITALQCAYPGEKWTKWFLDDFRKSSVSRFLHHTYERQIKFVWKLQPLSQLTWKIILNLSWKSFQKHDFLNVWVFFVTVCMFDILPLVMEEHWLPANFLRNFQCKRKYSANDPKCTYCIFTLVFHVTYDINVWSLYVSILLSESSQGNGTVRYWSDGEESKCLKTACMTPCGNVTCPCKIWTKLSEQVKN